MGLGTIDALIDPRPALRLAWADEDRPFRPLSYRQLPPDTSRKLQFARISPK